MYELLKQEVWWVQPLIRRYKLFDCCHIPEAIYSLFVFQNLKFREHIMDYSKWLYNKMHIEM